MASNPWDCLKIKVCSYIQRGIQSLGLFKAPYIQLTGRPVHSSANSTTLGIIQPCCNYCAKTIRSHIHQSSDRYSFIFIQLSELKQRGVIKIAQTSKRIESHHAPCVCTNRTCVCVCTNCTCVYTKARK